MEKNTLVAILAIFLIWTLWPGMQPKKPPPGKDPGVSGEAPKTSQPQGEAPGVTSGSQKSFEAQSAVTKIKTPAKTPERLLGLENEWLNLQVSSRTGELKGIQLNQFQKEHKKDSGVVNLVSEDAQVFPYGLTFEGDEILQGFRVKKTEPNYVELVWQDQNKLRITRTYELTQDQYQLNSSISIQNLSNETVRLQPGIVWNVTANEDSQKSGFFAAPPNVWQSMTLLTGNNLEKAKVKPGERKEFSGSVTWSSLGNRYFLMAIMPTWSGGSKVSAESLPGNDLVLQNTLWTRQLKIKPGATTELEHRVFIGPKELKILEAQGNHLNRTLDLGIFEFFALFLLRLMQFFQKFLGNWGLSIIALTFVVKLAFFPLSHKSFKSMKEMQRIQPLLTEIRERYKDDKEQLNTQMWKVMREHKVNPMGGCLPMLIQMPIYFALYKVLYSSIELRHTPFYGWIQDLSSPDPLFITPVLMGVAMFLQQRFSPKPPDPMQAKMMMLMPLMFSVFMLFLPSGLVIYIFCNTVLTILQQWYINRDVGGGVVVAGSTNAEKPA